MLTTIALALIAYYLLPGWWAALINTWVQASTPWLTGLILGFTLVLVGVTALRIALRIPARSERPGAGVARALLGVITAVALVAVTLTVFIALGVTEPLAQARELWQHDAPGLLAATLVGGLVATTVMLALAVVFKRPREIAPAEEEPPVLAAEGLQEQVEPEEIVRDQSGEEA